MARRKSAALVGAAAAALLAFPAVASADPVSNISPAGALTVSGDDDDAIAITCAANAVQVNGATVAGGGCDAITSIAVTAGSGANTIDLSGVDDADPDPAVVTDYPAVTSVTIDGGAGDDTITGSEHTDTLRGGDGVDRIVGDQNKAPGSVDVFEGQAGDDTLVWNPGHDSDKMDGGDGTDTIEVNGGGGGEQFTVNDAGGGRARFDRTGPTPPGPFFLDIGTAERLDMNANGGDDTFAAGAGLAALGLKLDIEGGDGADTIDGGDGDDLIHGGEGDDKITPDDNPALPGPRDLAFGDGGNDTMIWNGGDDDDLNEGGDGTDTIEVNGANLPEQFTVKPGAPGRTVFDRLAAPGPGPFNIDIGTAERLDLNMNGDNDVLTTDAGTDPNFKLDVEGGDGADSLDGGDAADLLAGGNGDDRLVGDNNPAGTDDVAQGDAGNDTMVWNPGDGDDVNEGGADNDTAEVNGGGGPERFTINPSPTPGRVAFDRTDPAPFNVDIGTTENLLLNAAGGDDRIKGFAGLAALIKSTLNGDDGNDLVRGTDGEDALSGGKGIDVINARDKAEDTVDCGRSLDVAFVDKRDFLRGCEVALGGDQKVKTVGKLAAVAGGAAAVKLKCVGAKRCKGTAKVRKGGKTLAAGKFRLDRGKVKKVRLELTKRGLRRLATAPAKGLGAQLVINSRDNRGNGWETRKAVRIAD